MKRDFGCDEIELIYIYIYIYINQIYRRSYIEIQYGIHSLSRKKD